MQPAKRVQDKIILRPPSSALIQPADFSLIISTSPPFLERKFSMFCEPKANPRPDFFAALRATGRTSVWFDRRAGDC
jgi:hypothetical protein